MIHTERATSNLARQAMDAATRARAGSDEGQVLLASTIGACIGSASGWAPAARRSRR